MCGTKDIDVPSVSGTISYCVLVFVPISRFFIGMWSILAFFFVDFDYAILNEALLKNPTLFLNIFVGLKAIHGHVMCKTWMGIINEHLDKMAL